MRPSRPLATPRARGERPRAWGLPGGPPGSPLLAAASVDAAGAGVPELDGTRSWSKDARPAILESWLSEDPPGCPRGDAGRRLSNSTRLRPALTWHRSKSSSGAPGSLGRARCWSAAGAAPGNVGGWSGRQCLARITDDRANAPSRARCLSRSPSLTTTPMSQKRRGRWARP